MADERDIKHFNKMANESKQRAANYMSLKGVLEPKQEIIEEAAYNYAANKKNRTSHLIGFREGVKWQQEQILYFLYSEITERRDYSASKMCEVVIEFIENM
jgi:hypothetical protein